MLGAIAVLAVASAVAMGLLYHPGGDPSRAYYGTDARAFELLIGSALALWVARRPGGGRRLWGFGTAALIVLGFAWVRVADTSGWMYRGGFVVAGLLAAVVVASVARPDAGPLGRLLSPRPLRWVGRLSYGMYLWHWPVIDLLTHQKTGLSGSALQLFQAGVTVAAATASYYVVERPVRAGALAGWRAWVAAPSVASATVAALVLTTATSGAVALAAPAPASVTSSASAPIAAPAPPVPVLVLAGGRIPTAADPLRVLVVGDSVMYDASPGIAAALDGTGVVRVTSEPVLGFGLTRSAYRWRTEWPKLVAADRPDVVLAMFGGWDGPGVLARGRAWYAGLAEEAVTALSATGARVVWLEYPQNRPPEIPGRPPPDQPANELGRQAVNAVLAGVAAGHLDTVAYLPTAPVLENAVGFTAFLPDATGRLVRVRKRDDVHFCPAGAARVGELVLRALGPTYALPPAAPDWEGGAWRLDPRYDNPHGTCS